MIFSLRKSECDYTTIRQLEYNSIENWEKIANVRLSSYASSVVDVLDFLRYWSKQGHQQWYYS